MSILYVSTNEVSSASATGGDTEDSLFPASNLGSGDPAEIFRFNAAGTDDFRYVDLGSAKNLTFASVHYHNIDAGVTAIKIQSDTTSAFSTPTDRATMTKRDPSFFATWSGGVAEQFWRILFEGTNGSAIYVGEWWLGTHTTLSQNQLPSWEVRHQMNQRRTGQFPQRVRAFNMGAANSPNRQLSMSFKAQSASERDEIQTMLNAVNWGENPIAIVPDNSDDIVIHGRVTDEWSWTSELGTLYPHSITIDEDPGPVIVT